MEEDSRIIRLFDAFREGYKARIVKNEHLLLPSFLEFISVICNSTFQVPYNTFEKVNGKVKEVTKHRKIGLEYDFGAKHNKCNILCFKIQQSSSGKGASSKYVGDLLSWLKYKTNITNNLTEAGIIGTVSENKDKEVEIIYGDLAEFDYLHIDEARILLSGKFTSGLLEEINGFIDNGKVVKKMAKGKIEYCSGCTISTGTFYLDRIKNIIDTGLLQRCFFVFKTPYSTEEMEEISRGHDSLAEKSFIGDFVPVIAECNRILKEIDFEKFKRGEKKEIALVVSISNEVSRYFGSKFFEFYKKEILTEFGTKVTELKQNEFILRSKEMGYKIMSFHALINGDLSVTREGADFALAFIKEHLKSIKDLLIQIYEGTDLETDKLTDFNYKANKIRKNEALIINEIKKFGKEGITRLELRDGIKKKRINSLLGGDATIKQIDILIEKGKIKETIQDHNRSVLTVD